MNVALAGFQAVGILKGGPLTQIRMTGEYLRRIGVETTLFDPWESPWPPAGKVDCVHIFSAGVGTYHLAREIRALGLPLVVSPIMFSRHTAGFIRAGIAATRIAQRIGPGIWSDYLFMAEICGWAKRVLPNTSAEGELVERGLGVSPERIRVVPNGVERRFEKGDPDLFRKKYGVADFILNVGHIGHPRKNVLSLGQSTRPPSGAVMTPRELR